MEKLQYKIEDSTIAELLGVQNFTNKESAILELVKNSFDAKAKKLEIIFSDNKIELVDDGIGMNVEDIKRYWMHIGKSSKEYITKDKDGNERVLSGSKGIGRFALSRLGENIKIYSEKENDNAIFWETNWEKSSLDELESQGEVGTRISIFNLRDPWNNVNIKKLADYLSRTFKNEFMEIYLISKDEKIKIETYLKKPKLGLNCLSIIKLDYNSQNQVLTCEVESDEFKDEARKYYKNNEINYFKKTKNMFLELKSNKDLKLEDEEELLEHLKVLGDFKAEFYFILNPSKFDAERFLYKHINLDNKFKSGVILYRNSFSISSYDGSKDWIGFSKRARKSPATAIHPTGAWRVRDNNIAGKVEIDKKNNENLRDLSNRQGLEENTYYEIFIKILDRGFAIFEKYRQDIIREINKKNIVEELPESQILNTVLKNPSKIKELSEEEIEKVASAVNDLKNETKKYKEQVKDTENKYRYDIRVLNTLSTSGLKATSIAHDLETDNNFIVTNSDNLVKALKRHKVWDIVNKEENKTISNRNVPLLIEKNKEINGKLSKFMSVILEESKKSSFQYREIKMLEILNEIKNVWEKDYSRIDINLSIDEQIIIYTAYDIIKVIFDNLILNTFQQNKTMGKILIDIEVIKNENFLNVVYKDYGKGLDEKYKLDPFTILEVHETNRDDGHGLGMWIVNNTIKYSGGKIEKIRNHEQNGFQIEFTLGEIKK